MIEMEKIEKESQEIISKFKEMRDLEKERDKVREKLNEMNVKVCRIQGEINDIVESDTRQF